jgi:hypothetical protein
VLYFYSPFAPNIFNQVMERIESSLRRSPRSLFVMFSGFLGVRDAAFGSRPQFKRLERGRYIDVYQHLSS